MLTKTLQSWLTQINKPESWLYPRLSEMSDWSLILERDLVISKIAETIRSGGLIAVCSDYDVDGISSGCIITDCVRQCGGRVQILVSSRFGGAGYGLSDQMVDRVLALGPVALTVTCDFGGSDHDRIQRLKDAGIPTCVIDHHVTPLAPLPSYGFLNPHRAGDPSTFKNLCSGGLALSVAGGVLKELGIPKSTIDPMQWVDLAGAATIADVVDLSLDNRAITRKALEMISTRPRPGLQALLELNKSWVPGTQLTARDISFKVAPGLNSPGRLGPPDIIVDLLLSKDIDEARAIAAEVKIIWDKRRLITEVITDECMKDIETNGYDKHDSIVLYAEPWSHGVVGIVAARIVDRYKVPTAVIGSEGRGSLRGPPGSRLHAALTACAPHLLRYGGHEAAAGLHISPDCVPAFREAFRQFFNPSTYVPLPAPPTPEPLPLDLSDNFIAVCDDLMLLEPTGQGNFKPVLTITGKVKSIKAVKGGHLKLDVDLGKNKTMGCFAIGRGDLENTLLPGTQVTVTGDLRKNEWRGKVTAEMFVENIIVPD